MSLIVKLKLLDLKLFDNSRTYGDIIFSIR